MLTRQLSFSTSTLVKELNLMSGIKATKLRKKIAITETEKAPKRENTRLNVNKIEKSVVKKRETEKAPKRENVRLSVVKKRGSAITANLEKVNTLLNVMTNLLLNVLMALNSI